MSDGIVVYDDNIGRFVITVLDLNDSSQTASIDFAISNSADATAGFSHLKKINVKQSVGTTGTTVFGDFAD